MVFVKVAIIIGSDSDWPVMKSAVEVLKQFGVEPMVTVASAHRTPLKVREIAEGAEQNGINLFIAAAGGAAQLAGVIASYTTLPVIGVPINASPMNGADSLPPTVRMPSGVPVATMAINGAKNAALFAVQILAQADKGLADKMKAYRANLAKEVDVKAERVKAQL